MKKLISVLVVLAIMASLSIIALAEEADDAHSIDSREMTIYFRDLETWFKMPFTSWTAWRTCHG